MSYLIKQNQYRDKACAAFLIGETPWTVDAMHLYVFTRRDNVFSSVTTAVHALCRRVSSMRAPEIGQEGAQSSKMQCDLRVLQCYSLTA